MRRPDLWCDCRRRGKLGFRATDTAGKASGDNGQAWSRVSASQGWLVTTRSWKGPGSILPWSLQREHRPADTVLGDLWPPELRENEFLIFSVTSVWHFVTAVLGPRCRAPSHVSPFVHPHVPSCSFPGPSIRSDNAPIACPHRTKLEVTHPTPGTTLIPKQRSDAPTSDWLWSRYERVWPMRDEGAGREGCQCESRVPSPAAQGVLTTPQAWVQKQASENRCRGQVGEHKSLAGQHPQIAAAQMPWASSFSS